MIINIFSDGLTFIHDLATFQSSLLRLLRWTCEDECKYECMWKTVDSFANRKWRVPQFYGKVNVCILQVFIIFIYYYFQWPFIRIFGIQEPASVVFSLLNFYIHYKMFKKFKREVRWGSPNYWMWHIFTSVSYSYKYVIDVIKVFLRYVYMPGCGLPFSMPEIYPSLSTWTTRAPSRWFSYVSTVWSSGNVQKLLFIWKLSCFSCIR